MTASDSEALELLARALRTLTDAEQARVLGLLVLPQLGPVARTARLAGKPLDYGSALALLREPSPDEKVGFLLRLPLTTHTALKQWSEANGHSMSVVMRVLIERFLADQEGRSQP